MSNLKFKRKPKRSLRTILIVWFLLFSIIPLVFLVAYSMLKFEKAIDHELSLRLSGNAREFAGILSDYRSGLEQKRSHYIKDPVLTYNLMMNDSAAIKNLGMHWLKQDFASSMTFFNRDGRMIVTTFKDEKGEPHYFQPTQEAIFLSEKYISHLKTHEDLGLAEFNDTQKLSLILMSRVQNNSGKIIGFLEQTVELDKSFLQKLKARMKLEVMFFKDNAELIIGSNPDFMLYKKDFFRPFFTQKNSNFFELNVRGQPYGFLIHPIEWGQTPFYISLGASKSDAKAVIKNVNYAFLSVTAAVFLLLILTILVTSSWVLKPLYELVDALHSFESQEQAITIPVKNDTEIGLLTESFNQMSQKIWQARSELRNKITELEKINKELKETQTRLVHSAKMISLGQLVAGVAHELNNPIGFIYSNMTHLRDYSQKLIKLVEIAEKNPAQLTEAKDEYEFDYITTDMPKLISSCEDGARRTKEIVLGLRNFSRLEEAKLKEVRISDSIDTTLELLAGEIKNRIQIHKDYKEIPSIYCYASQINQVFMNILSNAMQAIEGVGQIWISISFDENKKLARVSIQDSGKGMKQEIIEKIFDPFFTTKNVGQGTGLGLSISYGIVTSHGGEIQVKSEVNVGTEFIVLLPIHPPTTDKLIS